MNIQCKREIWNINILKTQKDKRTVTVISNVAFTFSSYLPFHFIPLLA